MDHSGCFILVALVCCACGSEANDTTATPNNPNASTGGMSTATGGTAGTTAGGGSTSATGGVGGSLGGGEAGLNAGGTAGTPAGGSGGTSAAGSGGTPQGGAGGADGFTDPGDEGDGSFTISPPYTSDAANDYSGAPTGEQFSFEMSSEDSTLYPGDRGEYTRTVWVYVPPGYVPGTPAPIIVVQDGSWAVWHGSNVPHDQDLQANNLPGTANLPRILDNLIAAGQLPKIVAIFPDNGGGDGGDSQRGLEYDTVSGVFAEYVNTEVLPRATSEAQTQLGVDLQFTSDPRGRATLGGSSGGAGSFSMAWWHPELFGLVISYSGTFVRQAAPEDPMFPHGAWSYHDFDPWDEAMPNGVIMQTDPILPLRIWLEVGENDMGAGGDWDSYRNFRLANERMAASLEAKGYHYHFDYAEGAGHVDGGVVPQTLPQALLWAFRGHPID
jgi:enterochelin esterase-like enzyme